MKNSAIVSFAIVMICLFHDPALADGTNQRVSVHSNGGEGNGPSYRPVITPDGKFVAFASEASNLVNGDNNGFADVFLHNRHAGTTELISLGPGGVQGNDHSWKNRETQSICITPDGRFVAFHSFASNLSTTLDTNNNLDVFVHDRTTGVTELVSVMTGGIHLPSGWSLNPWLSDDGRYVAFESTAMLTSIDQDGNEDVFVHDRSNIVTFQVSLDPFGLDGFGWSKRPKISGNGKYVAFQSTAANLVTGDTNGTQDIFVRDIFLGITYLVSTTTGGMQANGFSEDPQISEDGLRIVFTSEATNLYSPMDTNGAEDVFLHFLFPGAGGVTVPVSLNAQTMETGEERSLHADISPNGRWVVFETFANDIVDTGICYYRQIIRYDVKNGSYRWLSLPVPTDPEFPCTTGQCRYPSVNENGRLTAFASNAWNLILKDFNWNDDAFVHSEHFAKINLPLANKPPKNKSGQKVGRSRSKGGELPGRPDPHRRKRLQN